MITIVYLENPFRPHNRVVRKLSASETVTMLDAIAAIGVILPDDKLLSVNGIRVDADHKLHSGDFVVIAPDIKGGGGGGGSSKNVVGVIAGLALMAVSGGAGAGLLGIIGTTKGMVGLGLALYFGGSLMMGNQKTPKIDMPKIDGAAFEGGYSWSPGRIKIQQGLPVPITYGTIRTSGVLLAKAVTYDIVSWGVERQVLHLLIAANDGELDGIREITINDLPIASIEYASAEIRPGTNDQTATGIISSVVASESVGAALEDGIWVTRSVPAGVYSTFLIVFPGGLYKVDQGTGATQEVTTAMRLQKEVDGTWVNVRKYTFSGGSRKPIYKTIRVDHTSATNFRLCNITKEHHGLDEIPATWQIAAQWVQITTYADKANLYPNTALVALTIPALENLSGGLPSVSWEQTRSSIYAYNPTAGAYQQKNARNIAWMVYDLLHQCRRLKNVQSGNYEYAFFGVPHAAIDYAAFNAWATFCAGKVNGIARGEGDMLVDSGDQLWPIIQRVATSGRAYIVQQAGVFRPIWDEARAMTQIFTAGNILAGSLQGGYMPESERATDIEVSFINAQNGYERDTILVQSEDSDPGDGKNPTQVFLPGITHPSTAYRWGAYHLKKNKYLKRTLTLTADIDSIVSELGDVVGVQSDLTAWGVGGRIMGATKTQIVIDQDVTLEPGKTYSLLVRYPDDTLVRRVVDSVAKTTTTRTLYFTANQWATAPERYCNYSFGINTLEVKPFQIVGIRRNGDLQATIELVEYIAEVYSDTLTVPEIDYTKAGAQLNNLTVSADANTGTLGIAWSVPDDRDYKGAVVVVNGEPQGFFGTDQSGVQIGMPPGTYNVTVRPVDGSGRYGTGMTEEDIILGTPYLSPVTDLTLSQRLETQADCTSLIYITGTFTQPAFATTARVDLALAGQKIKTIQDSSLTAFEYGPVKPGTTYSVVVTARNKYTESLPVSASITAAGDTVAPPAPSIGVTSYLKTVTVQISLASVPNDMAGYRMYRDTVNNSATSALIGSVTSRDGRATYIDEAPEYGKTYYYWVRAFDAWGNLSAFSDVALTLITGVGGTDIVDGALARSELFAAGVVDAAAIADAAVTAVKTNIAGIDAATGNIAANAVGELQIVANAITSAKIKAGNVDAAALAANAVTNAKLAVNAVETAHISNQALKAPLGAVLSLSGKNSTTASIAETGGVRDVSGEGNHGQAFGGVTVVDSEIGKAFSFDGSDTYIDGSPYPLNDSFTVSCWIRHVGGRRGVILGDYTLSSATNTNLELTAGNKLRLYWAGGYPDIIWSATIPANTWAHILLARDKPSSKTSLYINGALSEEYSGVLSEIAVTRSFQWGRDSRTGETAFKGLIAHPRIYPRALSASEIKSLYMFPEDAAFGRITADLITTGELITKSAQIKDAIIEDAHITSLNASKMNTGYLAAERLEAGTITGEKIATEAISSKKLTVVAVELVNPVSVTGNVRGWCNVQEDGSGTSTAVSYDATESAIKMTTSGNLGIRSQSFLCNPNKIYRVACSIKKSAAHGVFYIGVSGFAAATGSSDGTGNQEGNQNFTPYNASRAAQAATSNPYVVANLAGTTSYQDFVFYVIGANRSINDVPQHTGGEAPYMKASAAAKHVAVRFLNLGNSSSVGMFIKNVSVSEVDAGQIVADNITAGAITATKVTSGELITKSAQIKDAIITNAKISDLNATKISAGYLAAERIEGGTITGAKMAANTITARELLIGSPGSALNDDPNFEDASAWTNEGSTGSGYTFAAITDGKVGDRVARIYANNNHISTMLTPIDAGKSYRLRAWVRNPNAAAGAKFYLIIWPYTGARVKGAELYIGGYNGYVGIGTAWVEVAGIYTPAAGTAFVRAQIAIWSGSTGYYEIQDFRIEEVLPATLIKDGAITTDKLAAKAVTAVKVSAGAIETEALAANAVTAAKIKAGEIGTTHLKAGAITADKLSVTALKAPAGAILELSAKGSTTASIAKAGGVIDVSGRGNHGQAYNGVAVVDSELGKAFSFDGSTTYINGSPYPLNGSFTVSCWIRHVGGRRGVILGDYTLSSATNTNLELTAGNKLRLYWADGYPDIIWSATIPANTWAHILLARDKPSSKTSLYINGALSEEYSGVLSEIAVTRSFQWGRDSRTGETAFKGLIAHPRIYPRALTAEEVKTLYMLGSDPESGVITADRVKTGRLESTNYSYSSGDFSTAGTQIDLDNGLIRSKSFAIKSNGDASFKGDITGASGTFSGVVGAGTAKFMGEFAAFGVFGLSPYVGRIWIEVGTRGSISTWDLPFGMIISLGTTILEIGATVNYGRGGGWRANSAWGYYKRLGAGDNASMFNFAFIELSSKLYVRIGNSDTMQWYTTGSISLAHNGSPRFVAQQTGGTAITGSVPVPY